MSPGLSRISGFDAAVFVVLLAAGAAVLQPHLHRSPFYDEAWVIEAAIAPDVTDGWAILRHDKSPAAAGYTAMLHEVTVLAPPSMPLFRIAHAVFGVAAVALAMRLAWAWHPRAWAMILPAAMLLAMPMYQRYATEVKQYIMEAAVTLGLILGAQAWVAGPVAMRYRAAWCWLILALLAVVMTFSGWFSVAGTGGIVFLAQLLRRDLPQLKRTVVMGIGIAAVAAVMHTQFNKHLAGSTVLEGYWEQYFLPLSAEWPAKAWGDLSRTLQQCWYRYEKLPGEAMLIAAMIGFAAWVWRQPVSGLAALAIVAVTLAASTAKLWPLNLRTNLHLFVLLHVAIAAGPVIIGSWCLERIGVAGAGRGSARFARENAQAGSPRANGSEQPPARATLGVVSLVVALLIAGVLWRESSGAKYEVESNDLLLDEVARSAKQDDIVLLMPAAAIQQRLAPRSIAGTIRVAPWPAKATIVRDILPLVYPARRPVLVAVSHHKPASGVPEAIAELGQAFSPFGRFSQQRFDGDEAAGVAIYRFEPAVR